MYDERCYENASVGTDEEEPAARQVPWEWLERLYRELKQNYEDRRDYARADDFHFREKEMQRQSPETQPFHRRLLALYWLFSGYGERVIRPMGWLIFLVVISGAVYLFNSAPNIQGASVVVLPADTAAIDLASARDELPARLDWKSPSDIYKAFIYSSETAFFLRPDELQLGAAAKATKLVESVLGPILIGLLALAIRQRLKR